MSIPFFSFDSTRAQIHYLLKLATRAGGGVRPVTFIAWFLLLVCTLLALIRPNFSYDTWWYHLPFSSFLWDIGGGAQSFHIDRLSYQRWLGFPKAWEWIDGLIWAVTGTLYSIIVPQLMLCAAYFAYVSRAHRIPMAWIFLAFFASPMLFIHFQSVHMDLPAAICVSLGFFLLLDLIADVRAPERTVSWTRAMAAIAILGLAGNIKYQSFLSCLCVSIIVLVPCLAIRDIPARCRAILIAVLLIANVLAGTTVISNFARYGNPFYPLQVKVLGTTLFDGPESTDMGADYPAYLLAGSREVTLPGPINFMLSATELDWNMRGVAPWYNINGLTGQNPRRGQPSRTGGWGGIFVLLNVCLLAAQAFHLRRETDPQQRLLVISTLLLIVATSCLPRAHELRYWLYVPLVLIPVNLRYLRTQASIIVPNMLVLLMAYGVVQTYLSPKSDLLTPRTLSMAALRAEIPPAITQALRETGRYCAGPHEQLLFRYSQATTGVPSLLSLIAEDCQ